MTLIVRELRWPEDSAALERLNTSFVTSVVYDVNSTMRGFHLVERSLQSPLEKRYPLNGREMADADIAIIIATEDVIVGAASLKLEHWNRRAIVSHLYVDTGERRKGIATRLLQEIRTHAIALGARSLFVETQNVNVPAVRFYERNGFTLVGLDTSLYHGADITGETALFFAAPLHVRKT